MSDAICNKCGDSYYYPSWMEPTTYCNECAHIMADKLPLMIQALEEIYDNGKLYNGAGEASNMMGRAQRIAKQALENK